VSNKKPFVFVTTRRVDSATCPGVVLHLRKLTEGRRSKLRESLAPHQGVLKNLVEQLQSVSDELAKDGETAQQLLQKWSDLTEEFEAIQAETIGPIWIKWGIKHVEGLINENGEPMTLDDLFDWPSELYNEALAFIRGNTDMSEEDRGNSDSPTTSGGQVAPSQTLSVVPPAEKRDGTLEETVPDTILN
jgi:hypothetical protein